MKRLYPVIGLVIAVLALTSKQFAHDSHRAKWIAAGIIVGVFVLLEIVATRRSKPKTPAAPQRTSYPYSGTRR